MHFFISFYSLYSFLSFKEVQVHDESLLLFWLLLSVLFLFLLLLLIFNSTVFNNINKQTKMSILFFLFSFLFLIIWKLLIILVSHPVLCKIKWHVSLKINFAFLHKLLCLDLSFSLHQRILFDVFFLLNRKIHLLMRFHATAEDMMIRR